VNPLSLEDTLSAARFWRDLGNFILIIFLVAEFFLAIWSEFPHDWSPWSPPAKYLFWFDNHIRCKHRMIVTAAAMVVVGVTLETVWGIRVDNVVDQMRLEMGPRGALLYGARREKLEARIKRFTGQKVETRFCSLYRIPPFNEEAMGVVILLPFVMREAGWDAPSAIPINCGGFGVSIAVSPKASRRTREAAEALRAALTKLPIDAGDKVWDIKPIGQPAPRDNDSVVVLVLAHPQ
jgi:hypothetical protein